MLINDNLFSPHQSEPAPRVFSICFASLINNLFPGTSNKWHFAECSSMIGQLQGFLILSKTLLMSGLTQAFLCLSTPKMQSALGWSDVIQEKKKAPWSVSQCGLIWGYLSYAIFNDPPYPPPPFLKDDLYTWKNSKYNLPFQGMFWNFVNLKKKEVIWWILCGILSTVCATICKIDLYIVANFHRSCNKRKPNTETL